MNDSDHVDDDVEQSATAKRFRSEDNLQTDHRMQTNGHEKSVPVVNRLENSDLYMNDNGKGNDDNTGKSDDNANTMDEDWAVTCVQLASESVNSIHRKHMEIVANGMHRRLAAQESLDKSFRIASASLDATLVEVMECVVPYHKSISEGMMFMEQDLLFHFGKNHDARKAIVCALESKNEEWQRTCDSLISRVIARGQADKTTAPKSGAPNGTGSDNIESKVTEENENDSETEPDWDDMVSLDPSLRDIIQAFLDSRDHWQASNLSFSNALGEIHHEIKRSHTNMLQIIEEAYGSICDALDDQQVDVQETIISNFARRNQLENEVAEDALRHQSLFSRLMARVSGTAGSASNDSSSEGGAGGFLSLSTIFLRGAKRSTP